MADCQHEWLPYTVVGKTDPEGHVCRLCGAVDRFEGDVPEYIALRDRGPITWLSNPAEILRSVAENSGLEVKHEEFDAAAAKLDEPVGSSTTGPHSKPEPFYGKHTIYDVSGENWEPYMTRYWLGRLRLHVFHRGDNDADPHDHPWSFWTFPLTSYVEEVTAPCASDSMWNYVKTGTMGTAYRSYRQVVRAFRLHYRPATHTHRVLGRWTGRWERPWPGRFPDSEMVESYRHHRPTQAGDVPSFGPGKIITLVWRSGSNRKWGFLKNRDGRWCWIPWKEYIYSGGKHGPCE